MQVTAKPFAWSYSRLKNYEGCPKRHWHIDINKDIREPESDELKWGNTLHKAAAARLKNKTPLPAGMDKLLEPWCQRIEQGGGKILVENQLAITKDFSPCDWFAKGERPAWFRSIADVIVLKPPVALAVDWKTGKVLDDSVQLALMAACIFAHHPGVEKIRTEFVWLKHNTSSREDFARTDMPKLWASIMSRVDQLRHAHETLEYPAKPSGLCRRWCPVTVCPHHGEG